MDQQCLICIGHDEPHTYDMSAVSDRARLNLRSRLPRDLYPYRSVGQRARDV